MSVVWSGAAALSELLVPIEELEPSENNPRRGNVEAIATSLERFGQAKPILVDGKRIIAGHHVRLAAIELGWTHLAAIENTFADEDEARAYLVADNRIHDLGSYDDSALVEHLAALAELDKLAGTGFTLDDLDDLYTRLEKKDAAAKAPAAPPPPSAEMIEVVLLYTQDQRDQMKIWETMIGKERGTDGLSDTYYEAMEIAANQVNG